MTEFQRGVAFIAEFKILLCVHAKKQIFRFKVHAVKLGGALGQTAPELQTKSTPLRMCFLAGLAGGLNKQIWHVKRVSNVARSLHERPST